MGRVPGINNEGAVYPQQVTLETLLRAGHVCLCIGTLHYALGGLNCTDSCNWPWRSTSINVVTPNPETDHTVHFAFSDSNVLE